LQHAERERLGALSDAPLPNNEAAEEHFDGSQIRGENRQFRVLLEAPNPSADAGDSGSRPAAPSASRRANLLGGVANSNRDDRLKARTDSACGNQFRPPGTWWLGLCDVSPGNRDRSQIKIENKSLIYLER
jgi:hypothetical protein